ncbi:aldo/keto reductase [Enterococcus sp. AZ196]|uniref:aldo/keto reductase n=1 Tax=Enterococcus sp. AZ196 TaxID=2774659 RepID=UPI003D26CC9B
MENNLRRLGNSELWLSPLGLGSWQFSGGRGFGSKFWRNLSQDQVSEIIRMSLSNGINWIDTAEAYGYGVSEQRISKCLEEINMNENEKCNNPILADKWWPLGRTAKSISKTISVRRKNLGGKIIDLYQIHHPTSLSTIEKQMAEMKLLVQNNHIRYVGVSNFSAKQMRRAHCILKKYGLSIVSNQVRYNLFDRSIEKNGVLDTAKELGISIIAYSPLHQGLLTGKFHDRPEAINQLFWLKRIQYGFTKKNLERTQPLIDELKRMGVEHNMSAAQIALAWLIRAHGETVFAIPGASNIEQVKGNIRAMNLYLTTEEINILSKII